ncbi:MAG: competence/damage-inducible protein A [Oscillospiraceae bacterium]
METGNAEILCIGTEILMGDIVNTNAAYLAKELTGLGIPLYHQTVVGDNPKRLKESLTLAFSRANIVITTGGLGPTYDDLSKEIIAEFFDQKLVMDEASLKSIIEFHKNLNIPMPENNKKQAMMPENATIFENPNGTAPGCAIEQDGKIAIMLPGPPREMVPMFEQYVVPYLLKSSGNILLSHNLHFYGIGESLLETKLHKLMEKSRNPTIAPYAKTGEVTVRVSAMATSSDQAEMMMEPVIREIKNIVGDFLYGVDIGDLQTAAVQMLARKSLHVAFAESCTAGLLSKRLTEVSGASHVFECGVCTYSNRMKEQILHVKHNTLQSYSAVSKETAAEMAAGVRQLSGAEIGLSVTGNAGPEPSEGKSVGLVYIGVDSDWHQEVFEMNVRRHDDNLREMIRHLASSKALFLLLKTAERYPE